MPAVDVVVPCYNYGRYLPHCVRSVLDQQGVDVRVLVIDDASTDDTQAAGNQLTNSDSRVEYVRHETNRGHIATYNEGLLEWANAEYSVLLSADDLLAPGALRRAASIMDTDPSIGLAYGLARILKGDASPSVAAPEPDEAAIVLEGERLLQRFCEAGNVVPTPTAVVRTALQRRLGGYLSTLSHSGDMEMWMRFAANGRVGITSAIQGFYRVHAANMSSHYYSRVARDREQQYLAYEITLESFRERFPDLERWVEAAGVRLARDSLWSATLALDAGDVDGYMEHRALADRLSPKLSSSRAWWKLRLRERLGPIYWRWLRRLRSSETASRKAPGYESHDETIGWWPAQILRS